MYCKHIYQKVCVVKQYVNNYIKNYSLVDQQTYLLINLCTKPRNKSRAYAVFFQNRKTLTKPSKFPSYFDAVL